MLPNHQPYQVKITRTICSSSPQMKLQSISKRRCILRINSPIPVIARLGRVEVSLEDKMQVEEAARPV